MICLKKYNNEVVGRTPCVSKRINKFPFYSIWKEDEIRLYLLRHPEIDHYCIIDDDAYPSDLDKVRDHLVKTVYYNKDNPDEEGLLPKYEEEIKEVLKKENDIKNKVLKYKIRQNV